MTKLRKTVICAACIAICVVLPLAFHTIPNGGNLFSPLHIPVLLCGIVCGPLYGGICGLFGALLSSVITGMPPVAYLPAMLVELFVYGLASGMFMKYLKTGKYYADLYISLVSAMLLGRIMGGASKAFIFAAGELTFAAFFTSYFVVSLPGIVIQLILIPLIAAALKRSKLIPEKY